MVQPWPWLHFREMAPQSETMDDHGQSNHVLTVVNQ